jgi:solute:Na+ symporter, SSS family
MRLALIDWIVIVGYLAVALGVGLYFRRRAGSSMAEYFVSGRSLPWWLAGTSMVATTFAADTPLAVQGLVAEHGLAGNWFWWAYAFGGMITVFFFARLWRRAEVLTDVELVELRYGGRPAAFLRGFRAVYVALLMNAIIMGWVTGAMITVLKYTVFSGTELQAGGADWALILAMLAVVGIYSTISGLWGVVATDFIQFIMAMAGFITLAVIGVAHVGGVDAMQAQVAANFGGGEQAFRFLPDFTAADPWMPLNIFLIMLFVQWWATWYPGAEPGGGGYIVQRMASAKDERHAVLATLWFQIAHYTVRPWPWLIIAFVALAMYPELRGMENPGAGFAMVVRDLAPAGVRGLVLIAFFAAFMSTISTQMNWGASYLVNDVYARFIRTDAGERHLTTASRIASVIVLLLGAGAAWLMRGMSVDQAWKFLAALGAGTGAVFMLRWYWWRINAWTEIAAMVASLVFFVAISGYIPRNEHRLAVVGLLTIVTWLVVTLVTKPETDEVLHRFYRKVRPGGPGWRRVARACPDVRADTGLRWSALAALFATGIIYLGLPGVGLLIFGDYARAALALGGAGLCAVVLTALMRRMGWAGLVR